jgi:hypothetical protein
MDIQLEKKELMKLLKETENPSIIKKIKCIFQLDKIGMLDKLSEEQKEIIFQNIKFDEKGNFLNLDKIDFNFV